MATIRITKRNDEIVIHENKCVNYLLFCPEWWSNAKKIEIFETKHDGAKYQLGQAVVIFEGRRIARNFSCIEAAQAHYDKLINGEYRPAFEE